MGVQGEQGAEGGSAAVVAADPAALETFWTTVCEGALLSSSHERRHLALQLFQVRIGAGSRAIWVSGPKGLGGGKWGRLVLSL